MDDRMASVLTTLSSLPVTRHTAFYHVTLFLLIHGLREIPGLRILNCNNKKVEIFEDSPAPVTCGDIPSRADVYWRRGDGVYIGLCYADGSCTSNLYNDYRLSRSPQSTESQLTLVPDYRRHAGVTVTCQDTASGSTASCTLVIRRRSELSECHVTTNPVDWTVSGSCRVQQAFSSDNIYTCTWTRNDGQTLGGLDASRELCSFTQALPQAGGLYTYSISVSPPPSTTTFSQQLTLVEPGDVTTTCPHSVVRGGDLSCTCQTTNTASPPATVRCEGRDSEKLVNTNVQREDNGTQFTCHVTWAGRVYTSITYTLLVKSVEGPTGVVINADSYPGSNGSRDVLLSCKAQAPLYPGANFTWSEIVCQNETHTDSTSTCTIMFGAQDDGKSVTCTAINTINSGIAASTTGMLRINGTGFVEVVLLTPSTTSSTGAIVGAAVAVLCIAVLIGVIVVFIRRQRHVIFIAFSISVFIKPQKPNLKKAAEETAQSEGEIYENFSFNDPTKVCTTQQTSSVKEGQNQSHVYENTHIQPAHIYDTTCTTYEQHKYADLTVKATPDAKVSEYEVPERKEGAVYSNA